MSIIVICNLIWMINIISFSFHTVLYKWRLFISSDPKISTNKIIYLPIVLMAMMLKTSFMKWTTNWSTWIIQGGRYFENDRWIFCPINLSTWHFFLLIEILMGHNTYAKYVKIGPTFWTPSFEIESIISGYTKMVHLMLLPFSLSRSNPSEVPVPEHLSVSEAEIHYL